MDSLGLFLHFTGENRINSLDTPFFLQPVVSVLVEGNSCNTPQFQVGEKNKLFWGWVHVPHSALHGALGPKACF